MIAVRLGKGAAGRLSGTKTFALDHLPEKLQPQVKAAMTEAYRSGDADRARRWLVVLAKKLETAHPGAVASLREGLDETLTVMWLELPSTLERTFVSLEFPGKAASRAHPFRVPDAFAMDAGRVRSRSRLRSWPVAGSACPASRGFHVAASFVW